MTVKPIGKAEVKDGRWIIKIRSKGNLDRMADRYGHYVLHHEDNNKVRKQYFFIHDGVMYITETNVHEIKKEPEKIEKPKVKPKPKPEKKKENK